MNFSRSVGDPPENVARNEDILREHLGAAGAPIVTVNQVHGTSVLIVEGGCGGGGDHDALVTARPRVLIGVKTADCTPVLLCEPVRKVVGAVHAGWRGTAALVAARSVDAMRSAFGCDPSDIVAVIGPSVGRCCYRVGDEVAKAFSKDLGGGFLSEENGGLFADLHGANRKALVLAGVRPSNIHVIDLCTACNPGLFFSHRRDGGKTGRHLNFAGLWT
ncbi:MAG: peptidoglycan editing factor PgeF [Deltaproteobacteria bacterium]|nr:peptidoglycan editing factor PgeF [Deltaproteobacteria bacterium]